MNTLLRVERWRDTGAITPQQYNAISALVRKDRFSLFIELNPLLYLGCLYYCFSRALPYSNGEVESPNLAFDYVLYLGCLAFGLELGYIETRFHLMETEWDVYLLISSAVCFALAYRFDNRFVLALALSLLAGWFGIKVSRFELVSGESLRWYALAYGVVVAVAGTAVNWRGIKKHFTETYLHVAANILFLALLSGVAPVQESPFYLLGAVSLGAAAVVLG